MKLKLQDWLIENEPGDNMLFKGPWWHTYTFWGDMVIPLMALKSFSEFENCDEYTKYLNDFHEIVGTHTSKSIVNPVLKIVYKGITFVFRYNFFDYEIAVIGDISVDLPYEYQPSNKEVFYYQGFPKEYCIKEKYGDEHKKTFMVRLFSHYDFYAFLVLMKYQIDKIR